jgi:hypothetical protein
MADSGSSNHATAPFLKRDLIGSRSQIQGDQRDQSDRKTPETLDYDEIEHMNCDQAPFENPYAGHQIDQQAPPGPQAAFLRSPYAGHDFERQAQFNPQAADPPLPNPHAHPAPNSLRFPIERYTPPDDYYDCDQFYLVRDAGVDNKYANCFGCGRPKQTDECAKAQCPGFPDCPANINCLFCGEASNAHRGQVCLASLPPLLS